MAKVWKIKPEIPAEIKHSFEKYPYPTAQLLYERGIITAEDADVFLNPDYKSLHSPFLFRDMEKSVERIWQAIEQGQGICIYGDYDADAVTANAVLQQTFKYLHIKSSSYIPDRFAEGYGVNMEALAKIRDSGCKIIITVDCGTNSVDAAEFCSANGMDLIITDHHEIIGPVPQSFALINPKNLEDLYPYHEITGVGVAFKLATALLSKEDKVKSRMATEDNSSYVKGYEKWLLDLVAVGTVADCHTLIGENRILVKYGLKVLAKTKWVGMRALAKVAELDFTEKIPDTVTLGFSIAPRLNAAGRLEHAGIALNLLLETDSVMALEQARALEEINNKRKLLTERVVSEAREQAQLISDRKVLVLQGEEWPKGIVGLVAGKIAEEYHKPAFVLCKENGESTGSARTVGDFNVVEALKYASQYLNKFGGHKQAAGLTLKSENFEKFYGKILEYADVHLAGNNGPQLMLDLELSKNLLTFETYRLMSSFEPFGVGNAKPKFLIRNLTIQYIKMVGATAQHAQFRFETGNKTISGIGFSMPYVEKSFTIGDTVDVAAEIIEDNWNGRNGIKLRLVDMRRAEKKDLKIE